MNRSIISKKVMSIAGENINEKNRVCPIDILVGLGWLNPKGIEKWQKGSIPYLEACVQANLNKISFTMKVFRSWAKHSKLQSSQTTYYSKGKGHKKKLRFSKSGIIHIENQYQTHYTLSSKKSDEVR